MSAIFNSGSQLSVFVSPSLITTPGQVPVQVVNPAPGGNGSNIAFLTVLDITAPVLTAPSPIAVEQATAAGTSASDPAIAAFLAGASATYNSSAIPTITNDVPANFVFPLGTTRVTFTATDAAGNRATATTTVTVVDTTPPALAAPADVTVEQTSAAGTPVGLGLATATDVCDASPTVVSDAPAVFPLGTTLVTFTATDAAGNRATATTTVTVVDTTPPALTVSTPLVVVEQTRRAGTPVDVLTASGFAVADLCDASPNVVLSNAGPYPLGDTVVTITALDDSGNSSRLQVTVRVRDTTAPNLSVPADIVVRCTQLAPNGVGCAKADNPAIAAWLAAASASDICDASPLLTNNAPAIFPVGFTTVTFRATDDSGNSTTKTPKVQVVYDFGGFEPPLLPNGLASILQGKSGRTIPVKFALLCGGTPVGTAVATIEVFKILNLSTGQTDATDLTSDSGNANDNGNLFRFDAVAQIFIYNLSTAGFAAPATYRIIVTLDDGTQKSIDFSLR